MILMKISDTPACQILMKRDLVDYVTAVSCGCKKGPNKSSCSFQFDRNYVTSVRDSCHELSQNEWVKSWYVQMIAIPMIFTKENVYAR